MTNFIGTQLTKKGLALIAKSGLTVTFTKAETGSGIYDEKEDISTMTELKGKKQSFSINSALKKTETQANVKFVVSNKKLTEGYLFTEIGLYALDPDEGEILYAVCYSTPKNATELQAYNGVFEASVIMSLLVDISNDGNVVIDPQGVYALEEDLCVTNEKLNHIADCLGNHTIKSNVPENAVFTDTVVGVQNNLVSTLTDEALSAAQGKVLNDKITAHTTEKANILCGTNGVAYDTTKYGGNKTYDSSRSWFLICSGGGSSGYYASYVIGVGTTVYVKSDRNLNITFPPGMIQLSKSGITNIDVKLFF